MEKLTVRTEEKTKPIASSFVPIKLIIVVRTLENVSIMRIYVMARSIVPIMRMKTIATNEVHGIDSSQIAFSR